MSNYINANNLLNSEVLKRVALDIKDGKLVIFPTETVYGIGTNGLSKEAVLNLYKVKDRPLDKPISLLVNSVEMVEKVARNISETEYKIMKKFFPGPLTLILEKSDVVPHELTAGGKTVGVRMPANNIALKLIEYANVPIAAPSANISGKPSGINPKEIIKDFENKVEWFIDGGISDIGVSSTIVKVDNGKIKILREGKITIKEIEDAINEK